MCLGDFTLSDQFTQCIMTLLMPLHHPEHHDELSSNGHPPHNMSSQNIGASFIYASII